MQSEGWNGMQRKMERWAEAQMGQAQPLRTPILRGDTRTYLAS